jgi:hypothetical protein
MMDTLHGLGYGIVTLAILVVVGLVVLTKLSDTTATCAPGFTYSPANQTCQNTTDVSDTADPTNPAWEGGNYLGGQLGSSGLSGWVPAIIAVAVGALFLSYFMGKRR